MYGGHYQNRPRGWPIATAKLPSNAMNKFVFGAQDARESKAVNPQVKTWYRHVNEQPQPYGDYEQYARNWFNQFIDGTFKSSDVAPYIDLVQETNETLANSQSVEEKARWIALHTAMAKVWNDEYRRGSLSHVRLILCETAIGNDIPWQIAEAAVRYDAALGYHCYQVCRIGKMNRGQALANVSRAVGHDAPRAAFHDWRRYYDDTVMEYERDAVAIVDEPLYRMVERDDPTPSAAFEQAIAQPDFVSPHDWRWYSGRWATMDAEFVARGLHVDWAFGEGGPVLDASENWSGWLDPLGGYKNPDCLGGSIDKYKQVLDYWLQNTFQTPAYQEGRILGLQLFTSGAPGGSGGTWANFDLTGDHMQEIANFAGSYDYPAVGKPPPPPPPPTDTDGKPRLQYQRVYHVLPQTASLERMIEVVTATYKDKATVGYSYDDSGIGALDNKTAVLYDIQEDKKAEYAAWFDKWYPGTRLQWIDGAPAVGVVVDVSHWQGTMNWGDAVMAGVTHAYVKATQGDKFLDSEFDNNWTGAEEHGIQRGAYHFWQNGIPGDDQAAWFLERLGSSIGELPPAIDVEDTNGVVNADELRQWLEIVEDAIGVRPVIYTARYYWDKFVGPTDWAGSYPLWVANYTDRAQPLIPTDWSTWHLWQYSAAGNGADYGASSVYIDLNRFS